MEEFLKKLKDALRNEGLEITKDFGDIMFVAQELSTKEYEIKVVEHESI